MHIESNHATKSKSLRREISWIFIHYTGGKDIYIYILDFYGQNIADLAL